MSKIQSLKNNFTLNNIFKVLPKNTNYPKKYKPYKQTKTNKKMNKKLNKITDNLVGVCNKILVKREDNCQCFNGKKYPVNDIKKCQKKNNNTHCKNYNKCKQLFSKFMSGTEPNYDPDDWSEPLVEKSHNCYAYFLDDKINNVKNKCLSLCKNQGYNNKRCKTNFNAVNECSNLKPQPGNYANEHNIKGFKRNRHYTCKHMKKKILIDSYNPKTNKSNIYETDFTKSCPKNYYKGGLTIQKGKTYHFYRQDKNARYSHKQGTLRVENVDASGKPIYAPHLADKNYNKQKSKDGIAYDEWCGYYCIPRNYHADTHAAGGFRGR